MSTITEPSFTTDWSRSISYWPDMFEHMQMTGKSDLLFLEIGPFEGRTTLWLIDNVLTDPSSKITVIDTFEGSPEFEGLGIDGDSWPRFQSNLAEHLNLGKCKAHVGRSEEILRALYLNWTASYDFIYVDGSHMAADVLSDAVLAWRLLKPGGVMCFDDYRWGAGLPPTERPQMAIEAFAACYASQLRGSPQGHDQYVVIKEKT